ncbi:matrixin family metalloprotease [Haloprofundus halophilus]|uniref:matrixin family metalloprotease n=1 Tax=Haloprofundus halophilus TaxID=2283527 RepID=UPI000E44F2CD|nr:matrixin family metalloprotease [Haloprofundus halophilus]
MSSRLPTLAVVALLLVAGCLGSLADGGGSSDVPLPSSSSTSTDRERATASTGTNPWGDDPVVVAIENRDEPDREFAPLVREATSYWEQNGREYTGFDVAYRVVPDAEDPDIVVEFVDEVPNCSNVTGAAGCAPRITDSRQIQRPETVSVRTGLSDASTELVLRHEFGHTLGLGHDDEPADVMAASSVLHTEPQPNATERAFPWADPHFTVYADTDDASDPEAAREQIRHAFGYYEEGADENVPGNLTFEYVDSPEDADVRIQFAEDSACDDGPGSCAVSSGPDPDGDGAIEEYERLEITLVELDSDAIGWHVGTWFATYGLGAENPADKPEPFQDPDPDYDEIRSEWWE